MYKNTCAIALSVRSRVVSLRCLLIKYIVCILKGWLTFGLPHIASFPSCAAHSPPLIRVIIKSTMQQITNKCKSTANFSSQLLSRFPRHTIRSQRCRQSKRPRRLNMLRNYYSPYYGLCQRWCIVYCVLCLKVVCQIKLAVFYNWFLVNSFV